MLGERLDEATEGFGQGAIAQDEGNDGVEGLHPFERFFTGRGCLFGVGGWVEEKEAVEMSYCEVWVVWVGGWVRTYRVGL